MESLLPFRHEEEKTLFNGIHPIVRFFLPFIFVFPILLLVNLFFIYTLFIIVLLICLVARLSLKRIFSRLKSIIPFIVLITIFIPFYYGSTVLFEYLIFRIYREGLGLAFLLFSRIFTVTFIFMALFSSFTYSEYIEALSNLQLPAYFVGAFMIMLHYIPIFAESNRKIMDAQELRGKKVTSYWQRLKAHAFIMGKAIVMNMERSEKLYESLKMRGFAGKISLSKKKIKIKDVLVIFIFIFVVVYLAYFIDLEQFYVGVVSLFL